ncbi:hypothetical protein [Actinophytocola xanthii]|uniref:Transcriptional regulator n=1 Tax=Actinophytocola xanthii TaxID=1912961 RepID=A0A1Q8CKV8_9PSEU|nr:hypothetical protein [Actinophytocola xanthii]OLF14993.1 hypothetical protein BU204_24110 [Actinophytocola xanthii]
MVELVTQTASNRRTLREAGLIIQRDAGNGIFVRLRREEFERRFPGLLATLTTLTALHRT